MYLQNDVMCVLPTGSGKSLVFHLLPMLLFARGRICGDLLGWKSKDIATAVVSSIVMVVSPLNSLMSDQVSHLYASGIRASIIDINKQTRQHQSDDDSEENIVEHVVDFRLCEEVITI